MNVLLVHGAWHSAAHWNKVAEELTAHGHRVHAMDLPGSGLDAGYPESYLRNDFAALASEASPIGGVKLADYRDAIVAEVRELAPHGKVTLVGHSFGGLAITQAAEAVPELIERLVYLTAYVPAQQATGAALAALPEGASSLSGAILVGDPMTTGAMRINPRNSDPDYVEKGRQALYSDVSTERYVRFAAYLNPDLPLPVARRRPRHGRALGQRAADVHPHDRGPHGPARPAGPHDRRGRRADTGQPVRRPLAALEPLAVRLDAGPPRGGPAHAMNPAAAPTLAIGVAVPLSQAASGRATTISSAWSSARRAERRA
jgi:pimeloyl-ACP methyl ester carboxylesterase